MTIAVYSNSVRPADQRSQSQRPSSVPNRLSRTGFTICEPAGSNIVEVRTTGVLTTRMRISTRCLLNSRLHCGRLPLLDSAYCIVGELDPVCRPGVPSTHDGMSAKAFGFRKRIGLPRELQVIERNIASWRATSGFSRGQGYGMRYSRTCIPEERRIIETAPALVRQCGQDRCYWAYSFPVEASSSPDRARRVHHVAQAVRGEDRLQFFAVRCCLSGCSWGLLDC